MICEPGCLILIPFPFSNLSATKKRPVLVLTPPDRHGDLICLAITSVPTQEYAVPVTEDSMLEGKLPRTSWIRVDKIFTLDSKSILQNFGQLRPEAFEAVLQGICHKTGCQDYQGNRI